MNFMVTVQCHVKISVSDAIVENERTDIGDAEHKGRLLSARNIPLYTPDLSPYDFSVFGLMKKLLKQRYNTYEDGYRKLGGISV